MTAPAAIPDPRPRSAAARPATRDHLAWRVLRNPLGLAGLIFLAIIVLSAILAPVIAPTGPNTADINAVLVGPGSHHLFGTDGAGRDVFSRFLFASRNSLSAALLALLVALVLGVPGGLVAGYFGKWFDLVSAWGIALLMALPSVVVLLAARAVIGTSLYVSMAIFGVLLTPSFFRLVYSSAAAVRNELYVDAARVTGLSDTRIIVRHVLTVIRGPIIIQSAIVGGLGIAVQSGLDFLGLGDINTPTWGLMLNDAFANLYRDPLLIAYPASAIALTLVSLTLIANTTRDELERTGPKRGKHRPATTDTPAPAATSIIHRENRDQELADPVLKIDGLSIAYARPDGRPKYVVEEVTLSVGRGEVHGLVGESGSGKTQTAWSVLRLLPEGGSIASGSILFDGTDLVGLGAKEMRRIRGRRIAYIPQEPMSNLDPCFTIGSQLIEPLKKHLHLTTAAARARALELLERVGIPDPQRTMRSYPHQVSGGMAQRVLIAGAISCEPVLLIADEPTTALDVTVQAEALDVLRDLQAELHMGVILVTHNFGVVADLCDRVSVMKAGRIVESGATPDIFARPQHPYTRELLGAVLYETEPRGPLHALPSGPAVPLELDGGPHP